MFKAIAKFVTDTRINYDFRRYEKEARKAYRQKAGREFSTKKSEDEIRALIAGIDRDAEEQFGAEISRLAEQAAKHKRVLAELEKKHEILTRDYQGEIQALTERKKECSEQINEFYGKKTDCNEAIKEAHDDVSEAYADLNRYKEKVDDWYAKSDRSPWLLGNAGRKLPNRSLFGQSHGDLDWAKDQRDRSWDEVCEAKDERSALFAERDAISASLSELKALRKDLSKQIDEVCKDRRRKFELKDAGQTARVVLAEISRTEKILHPIEKDLEGARVRKSGFVSQEKKSRGVDALEDKIAGIKSRKEKFLEAFDLPEVVEKRRQAHREEWLAQH